MGSLLVRRVLEKREVKEVARCHQLLRRREEGGAPWHGGGLRVARELVAVLGSADLEASQSHHDGKSCHRNARGQQHGSGEGSSAWRPPTAHLLQGSPRCRGTKQWAAVKVERLSPWQLVTWPEPRILGSETSRVSFSRRGDPQIRSGGSALLLPRPDGQLTPQNSRSSSSSKVGVQGPYSNGGWLFPYLIYLCGAKLPPL